MRKLLLLCFFLITCAGSNYMKAQKQLGLFNSIAIGVSGGTTGIGVDMAAPIGNHFAIRAGVSYMPNFSFKAETEVNLGDKYEDYNDNDNYYDPTIDLKGELGRTSAEVLLNIYPFKSSSFFLCGGAYFGGKRLIKMEGHSDELQQIIAQGGQPTIEIGNYIIPVDKNGNVSGKINVASFRPYVGFGLGRAVPKKRIGFMFELGVQFHKSPVIDAEGLVISQLESEDDTEFSDIINKVTCYPVLKFRICGRLF